MPLQKEKKLHLGDQEGLKIAESDEKISKEELEFRVQELEKCRNDIDYFANNYFYVLNPRGDKVKIKLYPKQSELLHKIIDRNRVISCAARQNGKTTTYVILCVYQILFQKNYNILIAGNKGETARDNLAKIKDGFEALPNWMKPPISIWNESKIKFKNGVVLKAVTTTASTGRSGSIDMLILDEFAFVPKNVQEEFWKASLPTVSARPKAKIIIVSTPNGVGDKFHEVWQMATSGQQGEDGSVWIAHKIDWWERPDRDDAWYKRELSSLGSKEAFEQEYGNSFTVTAGNKLVPDERQLELKKLYQSFKYNETIRNVEPKNPSNERTYTEYFPYKSGRTYVGAVDTAEGTGQDNSVFYIFDITEGRTIYLCAKFESAKVIPSEYAKVIFNMSKRYGDPLLLIESNAVGAEVIDTLTRTGVVDYFTKKPQTYENVARYNRKNYLPGILSHLQVKVKACLNAQRIIQNRRFTLILPDRELFNELAFFERQNSASGSIVYRANKGKHDDHVMAFIWGLFSLTDEISNRYFVVEKTTDQETGDTYPTLILNNTDDIDAVKDSLRADGSMPRDEKYELAARWYEMGDAARADFILKTMFDEDAENGDGEWTVNPYQIDVRKFSEGFFGERYRGMGRQGDFFKSTRSSDDSYGAGWVI